MNRPYARPGAALRRADGVSLVEMLVAMSILSIVLVGVAAGLIQGTGVARESRHRTVAASLAAEEMDIARAATFDLLDEEVVERQIEHRTGIYDVRRQSQWVTDATGQSACTVASQVGPDGVTPSYLRVDVAVDWPTRRPSSSPVTNATVITPPIELYDPTAGHIAVTVLNAAGDPAAGVTVTITADGAGAQTRMTDASGCAFFGYLSAGDWEVELDQPGYVDRDGDPNPSEQQLVQPTETASVQFSYDRAVTINTTLVSEHGGLVPPEVVRTAVGPEGSQTQSDASFASLFPFPAGFNVWGGCTDNSPGTFDADTSVEAPLPGTTVDLQVPLPTVEVRSPFLDGDGEGGFIRRRVDVRATSASAQPGCGDPIDLGRTSEPSDADGVSSVRVGLPYGAWRFDDPDSGWCTIVVLEGDGDRAPGEFVVELEDRDCDLPAPPGPPSFDLDITVVGQGQVVRDPTAGPYEQDTTVAVTATADTGWRFDGWSGAIVSSQPSESVVMFADLSVTATFVAIPSYTLTTGVAGSGTIDPPAGAQLYDENTVVSVSASAEAGWRFTGWSGDLSGDGNPASVVMDADRTVTANFTQIESVTARWTFDAIDDFGPQLTPDVSSITVSDIASSGELDPFGIMNNDDLTIDDDGDNPFNYEPDNAPVLRVGPNATTGTAAFADDSYFEFTVTPAAGGDIDLEQLRVEVARGGGSTPRGFAVRTSDDGYASPIITQDVAGERPNLSSYVIDVGVSSTQPVTLRVYVYSPGSNATVEFADIQLDVGFTAP